MRTESVFCSRVQSTKQHTSQFMVQSITQHLTGKLMVHDSEFQNPWRLMILSVSTYCLSLNCLFLSRCCSQFHHHRLL
uniref:Uncharacterized protein n=1 Tax=Arundo donax TaxID=35708 RepID=A0A0A8YUY5_ARUDO